MGETEPVVDVKPAFIHFAYTIHKVEILFFNVRGVILQPQKFGNPFGSPKVASPHSLARGF